MNSKGTNMPNELPGCCTGASPDCCAKTTRVANMRFLRLLCSRFALGCERETQAEGAYLKAMFPNGQDEPPGTPQSPAHGWLDASPPSAGDKKRHYADTAA